MTRREDIEPEKKPDENLLLYKREEVQEVILFGSSSAAFYAEYLATSEPHTKV